MKRLGLAVAIAAVSFSAEAMGPDPKARLDISLSKLERLMVRIANREITRRASGLSVQSANTSLSATVSASANSARTAQTATAATTAGFAERANRASAANVADNATFAASANRADTAGSAGFANSAVFADSANPAVFARITPGGNIDPAFSKGITQANVVTAPGERAGLYCFKGIPGIRGATVTAETPSDPLTPLRKASASFTMGVAGQNTAGPGCPSDAEFGIDTSACNVVSGVCSNAELGVFLVIYR